MEQDKSPLMTEPDGERGDVIIIDKARFAVEFLNDTDTSIEIHITPK